MTDLEDIREAVRDFVEAHPEVVQWNFGPALRGIADGLAPDEWYGVVSE